jgi:tubulin alpha
LFTARVGNSKSEIISLHIGQAGIQMGNSMWELYCIEHGIDKDGSKIIKHFDEEDDGYKTIFKETSQGRY